jgi:hypothetical protein
MRGESKGGKVASLSKTIIEPEQSRPARDLSYVWDVLAIVGAGLLIAAGFVLHLAAGLGLLGAAALAAGILGAREAARRAEEKKR